MAVSTPSFWEAYQHTTPYLDKKELAKSGEPFYVIGVQEATGGKFGTQWVLDIRRDNGELARISFTKTPNRDDKMEMLRVMLDSGELIQAKLETFKTNSGQTGYDLAPVDEEQIPFDFNTVK